MNNEFLFKNGEPGEMAEHYPEKASCTSKKFKLDLYEFFNKDEFKDKIALEVGIYGGHTTRILSHLFVTVHAFDNFDRSISGTQKFNSDRDNIEYYLMDVYNDKWPDIKIDITFIDAVHTTENTTIDINNSILHRNSDDFYLAFDDYGNHPDVKKAIESHKDIQIIKRIGLDVSSGSEGVICKYIGGNK